MSGMIRKSSSLRCRTKVPSKPSISPASRSLPRQRPARPHRVRRLPKRNSAACGQRGRGEDIKDFSSQASFYCNRTHHLFGSACPWERCGFGAVPSCAPAIDASVPHAASPDAGSERQLPLESPNPVASRRIRSTVARSRAFAFGASAWPSLTRNKH